MDKLKNSEDASKIIGDAIKIERVLKIVLTSQVDQLVSFGDVICYLKVIGWRDLRIKTKVFHCGTE